MLFVRCESHVIRPFSFSVALLPEVCFLSIPIFVSISNKLAYNWWLYAYTCDLCSCKLKYLNEREFFCFVFSFAVKQCVSLNKLRSFLIPAFTSTVMYIYVLLIIQARICSMYSIVYRNTFFRSKPAFSSWCNTILTL